MIRVVLIIGFAVVVYGCCLKWAEIGVPGETPCGRTGYILVISRQTPGTNTGRIAVPSRFHHSHFGGGRGHGGQGNNGNHFGQYGHSEQQTPDVDTMTSDVDTMLTNLASTGCSATTYAPAVSYIVGGSEARAHSWPWMVLLEYNGYHVCGGSLISRRHVLTAAHCVTSGDMAVASNWQTRVGKHDISIKESTEQQMGVSRIISHKRYNSGTLQNDIAVMVLSEPVTLNDYVQPVCITDVDVAAGTNCVATGWGNTLNPSEPSNKLRQVTVPIIDQNTCQSERYYGTYMDPQTMICAGYEEGGRDSCQGDSGGPLVCPSGNSWALTGITSWGFGCAEAYKPGVYTRVYHYRKLGSRLPAS